MSNHSPSTSPDASPAMPLAWMLALLREAMVGVMADDQPPLKKANALARLGSLYLKAHNTVELKRVNAGLEARVAELEERLAAFGVETAADEESATQPAESGTEGSPASSRPEGTKPAKPRASGKPHTGGRHHPRRGPRAKAAGRK